MEPRICKRPASSPNFDDYMNNKYNNWNVALINDIPEQPVKQNPFMVAPTHGTVPPPPAERKVLKQQIQEFGRQMKLLQELLDGTLLEKITKRKMK